MIPSDHPPESQLREFALGKLTDEEALVLADHLNGCSECQTRLENCDDAADFFVELLQRQVHGATSDDRVLGDALAGISQVETAVSLSAVSDVAVQATPARLREYELLCPIGQGGMSTVFKARHVQLDRIVALKVLKQGRFHDPHAASRFDREIKAVGRLCHQNIVRATDAGRLDGYHFLVMEFIDGADVGTMIKEVGRLALPDACEVIRQTAVALEYTHENGLVHRDVKPSNIMVDRDGRVRLLDLGLARWDLDDESLHELTGTGRIMGTVDYMAPEQAESSRNVDAKTDIYSLGCTFYSLLAGRPPFPRPEFSSTVQKLVAHASQPVPPLTEIRRDVPRDLSDFVGRMLAKSPAERPQAAREVVQRLTNDARTSDLSALVSQCPLPSRGSCEEPDIALIASLGMTTRFARRHWWAGRAGLATVVSLLVLGAISIGAVARRPMKSETAAPPNDRQADFVDAGKQERDKGGSSESPRRVKRDKRVPPEKKRGGFTWRLRSASAPESGRMIFTSGPVLPSWVPTAVPSGGQPDADGNPLPPHATARLGSICFRNATAVRSLKFSHDGQRIISHTSRVARIWETATGKELKSFYIAVDPSFQTFAFAPDESTWAGTTTRLSLFVFRDDGKVHFKLENSHYLSHIAFSPDGRTIAGGGPDGDLRLWSVEPADFEKRLEAHDLGIYRIAFSPDGRLLASVGGDGFVRVWELPNGELDCEIKVPPGGATALTFDPNGHYLATTAEDGSVRVLSLQAKAVEKTWKAHEGKASDLDFSPNGELLATGGSDRTVRVWRWKTGEETFRRRAHLGAVTSVAFSPDGKTVASGGHGGLHHGVALEDSKIRLWDIAENVEVGAASGDDQGGLFSAAITSDAGRVVTAGNSGRVFVWDSVSGKKIGEIPDAARGNKSVAASPDGKLTAVTSRQSVSLYDMATMQQLASWELQPNLKHLTSSASFSPDGLRLATANGRSGELTVRNVTGGKVVASWQAHASTEGQYSRLHVQFSPDGRLIASLGRSDATLAVWDAQSFELLYRISGRDPHVFSISNDSRLLVSGTPKGELFVDEVMSGQQVFTKRSAAGFNRLLFAHDNRTIVGCDSHNQLLLFDVATGDECDRFIARTGVNSTDIAISRDGSSMVSAGEDGTVLVWDLPKLLRKVPKLKRVNLSQQELERLWTQLGASDTPGAFAAIWKLVAAGQQAARFLRTRLPTEPTASPSLPVSSEHDRRNLRAQQVLAYLK